MEAAAHVKFIRMSPQKIQRVINIVRGLSVEDALNLLHFTRKNAAEPVSKAIRSAFANLGNVESEIRVEMKQAFVKTAFVNSGPTLKRFRPMSMGRAGKIRKRTSHLTIIVEHK